MSQYLQELIQEARYLREQGQLKLGDKRKVEELQQKVEELEHHGSIVSDDFPPVVTFQNGLVRDLVRVYAGADPDVLTLQSDLELPPYSFEPLSQCIIGEFAWTTRLTRDSNCGDVCVEEPSERLDLQTASSLLVFEKTVTDTVSNRSTNQTSRYEAVGLLIGFFLLSTAAAAYEIAPASVLPVIQASLGIDGSTAGLLVSIMYATAVVTSVPIGIVLDRVSVRQVVFLGAVALVVAGIWGWYAASAGAYLSLLASRVLGGLAYVIFWNAGANAVGSAVESQNRATAVGVFTASAPVGFALGQFGSPLIEDVAGWPVVFPLFAALGVVGITIFLLATRSHVPGVDAAAPDRTALRELFTSRAVWIVCVLCFLAYSLYLFVNTWLPSYLVDGFEISLATSGLLTALFPAIGAIARSSSGVISDRVFSGKRRPVILSSFVITTPAMVAFAFVSQLGLVVGAVIVVGFAIQLITGLIFSYIAELVAPTVRTTAVSLLTSIGLLGAFSAPIVGGAIIDWAGYSLAFFVAGGVALIGVLLALRAPEPGGDPRGFE